MNIYCDTCSKSTKYNSKINCKVDGKLIFILAVLTVVLKSLKLLIRKSWVTYWKFKLYIKQCYHIFWSLEKKINIKTRGLQRQIKGS